MSANPEITEVHEHHAHVHYGIDLTDPKQARTYAAIQIMAGLSGNEHVPSDLTECVQAAVEAADALFAELEKEPT